MDFFNEIWETIARNRSRSLLTGFGVFWGMMMLLLLVGMGVVALIGQLTQDAENQILLNPSVNLAVVAIATTIIVFIGVVAGAIPALRAMKIKPIEAMREK